MLKLAVTCGFVLALLAIQNRPGLARPTTVLSAPLGEECGTTDCFDTCAPYWHTAPAGSTAQYQGPQHSSCNPGDCNVHMCASENDENALSVPLALKALETGSMGSAEQLAARYPKSVAINRRFNAVQIKNCSGVIVAHIPLTSEGLVAASVGTQ